MMRQIRIIYWIDNPIDWITLDPRLLEEFSLGWSYRQEYAAEEWRPFFKPLFCERDMRLPALRTLTLDFSRLQLGTDGFMVKPIVEKLRMPAGLKKLKVIGLRRERCLDVLKGLVAEGGIFEVCF